MADQFQLTPSVLTNNHSLGGGFDYTRSGLPPPCTTNSVITGSNDCCVITAALSYVREYEECDLLFEAIIWNLWLDRNSVVFEVSMEDKHSFLARCPPFHMCVSRALAMTRRILNVTKDGTTLASQGNDWQSPPADWVKLNTDGARHGESGHASYGGIIRDTEKAWILGYTKFIGHVPRTKNQVANDLVKLDRSETFDMSRSGTPPR
ncbi:hypothetical protein V6N11_041207 [Hibiscus sabdariffa]|uniref:RNase H type-1 domain-containing protein n=1 Tax=Hibiscus sabdariffa TaxID=183260 RepID=A0ABR2RJP9_9ROSI